MQSRLPVSQVAAICMLMMLQFILSSFSAPLQPRYSAVPDTAPAAASIRPDPRAAQQSSTQTITLSKVARYVSKLFTGLLAVRGRFASRGGRIALRMGGRGIRPWSYRMRASAIVYWSIYSKHRALEPRVGLPAAEQSSP